MPKNIRLNQELQALASCLPEALWLMLVSQDGIEKARFPEQITTADRVPAMSAAAVILGERIMKDLKGGAIRYSLVGGKESVLLVIYLSKDLLLALGLKSGASMDAVFLTLGMDIQPSLLQSLREAAED